MRSLERDTAGRSPAFQTLRAYVELFHFPPILMVLFATTAFATIAAGGVPSAGRLAPYLLAVLFTQMAIGAHNDYCDRKLDASAKPWRAIPAGLLTPTFVIELVVLLTALGVALSLPLGARIVAIGVAGDGRGVRVQRQAQGDAVRLGAVLDRAAGAGHRLV